MRYFIRLVLRLSLILSLCGVALPQANANFPLVIVVHGIGGGNRNNGWSREIADRWGVEAHEVTFRYEGRDDAMSYQDFVPEAGNWALNVQRQIKDIVRQNPGRRVMIVSHSWGTVVTKMALDGGMGGGRGDELGVQGYNIEPIPPGTFEVEEWVTVGAALGRDGTPELAGNIMNWRLDVPGGLPKLVKHWTNFYDVDDPVSRKSHDLNGAENVSVTGSGYRFDLSGMSAHTGIWTNPVVNKHIFDQALRISNMKQLPATRVGDVTGPPLDRKPTRDRPAVSASSEEQIVGEYRSLLPQVLQKNKKPWHTRINIIANADKQGSLYRVNYQTYCLIETGPDTGKDYMCFEFEKMFDLGGLKGAVAEMKQQLGR